MVKHTPKMTALVVSAIRNLREVQGSTPAEILNYIVAEYNANNPASDSAIQRKLCTALKRGLEYGILKRVHGHYSLNTDPETINPTDDMLGPMERGGCCKGAVKRRRRKGCKSKPRRKRACGGKKRRKGRKGRSRGRKGGCKSRGKSRRRRSRRGKSRKCGGKKRRAGRRRRSRSGKCCSGGRGGDDDMLAKDPIDTTRHRENIGGDYRYDREERRSRSRGRQSAASRSRSPTHSRSSGSSDREANAGIGRDRQTE